jgi:hypothetical protein
MISFSSLKPLIPALAILLLVSCNSTQKQADPADPATPVSQADPAAAPVVKKLDKSYDNLMFSTFTAKAEIARDYPQAAKDIQHGMMTSLQMEDRFKKVITASEEKPAAGDTLIIKADITDMRIVPTAARIWGGPMAGSSGVELTLQLVDGATQKMIREEKISSWNNAWGASWSGSDNTLLSDVGKITAQYVIDSMPEKQAVAAPVATAPTTPAKKSTTNKSKKK